MPFEVFPCARVIAVKRQLLLDGFITMKIGYPCINRSIGCTANSTFRLASYSEEKIREKIQNNLECLSRILEFNADRGLLFFRISSDLIPFASHPVCQFEWRAVFSRELESIGRYIKKNRMRISMHPDQFVVLNSKREDVVANSVLELEYHRGLLDAMGLDGDAKIQIHVGGVYGDRDGSINRFISSCNSLGEGIKRRLVIENDDRNYGVKNCLRISGETGVPVLLDVFHHECLNSGEPLKDVLRLTAATWGGRDGSLMVDYSLQARGKRKGTHAESMAGSKFKSFLRETEGFDFDLMLEIKDKEKSALKALKLLGEVRG